MAGGHVVAPRPGASRAMCGMGEQERARSHSWWPANATWGRGDLYAFLDGPSRLVMLGARAVLGCNVARARLGWDGWT